MDLLALLAKAMLLLLATAPVLCWPVAVLAAPAVQTSSSVYVEHRKGQAVRRLEPARSFRSGDRVVTILRWQRLRGDGGFTITNPVPTGMHYEQSSHPGEEVSVDGGESWGRLGTLKMRGRDATPEDVTHVRWRIPATQSSRGRGQIAYSGIVR